MAYSASGANFAGVCLCVPGSAAQTVKQQQKLIQEIIQEKRKKAEQLEQEQRLAINEGRKKKTESGTPSIVPHGIARGVLPH